MNVSTVRVTDKHIAEGRACIGSECPIALAVLEALAAENVAVDRIQVDIYDVIVTVADAAGRLRFRADLDIRAARFIIESFDEPEDSEGRDATLIAPFEFELSWQELAS